MGCVLYCIGDCKQIMVGVENAMISEMDAGSASGMFLCDDCEKKGTGDRSHPFAKFAKTESEIKQDSTFYGGWTKRPMSVVMP